MPRIQVERQGISLDVPGVSIPVGQVGRPQMALAGAADKIGNTADSILDAVMTAEASETSNTMALKQRHERNEYLEKLQQDYPSGYVTDPTGARVQNKATGTFRTISDEYKDWSEQQFKKGQESQGSELASRMYRERALPMFYDGMSAAKNTEMQLRTESFISGINDQVRKYMNSQIENPDPSDAYDTQKALIDQLNSQRAILRMSPEQYAARVQMIQKSIPSAIIDGYKSQIMGMPKKGKSRLETIEEAMAFVNGQDKASTQEFAMKSARMSETMNPEEKAATLQWLQNAKQLAGKMDAGDYLERVKQNVMQAKSKEGVMPGQFEALNAEGLKLFLGGAINVNDFLDSKLQLNLTKEAYPIMASEEFHFAPTEKRNEMIEGVISKHFQDMIADLPPEAQALVRSAGIESREAARQHLERFNEKQDKLAKDDFVTFAQKNRAVRDTTQNLNFKTATQFKSPLLRGMYSARNRYAEQLAAERGERDIKYLRKEEAQDIASIIKNPKSIHTDIYQMFNYTYEADPGVFHKVVQQVIEEGNLPDDWHMALIVKQPELAPLAVEVIDTLVNKGKYVDEGLLEKKNTSEAKIKSYFVEPGQNFFANLLHKQGDKLTSTEHQTVVNTMYRMTMKKLQQDPNGITAREAADQTIKQFLGAKFHLDVYVGGTFSGEQTIVPKYYMGEPVTKTDVDNIRKNLSAVKKNISSMKFDTPEGLPDDLVPYWTSGDFFKNPSNTRLFYNDVNGTYDIKWRNTSDGTWPNLLINGEPASVSLQNARQYRIENRDTSEKISEGAAKAAKSAVQATKKAGKEAAKALEKSAEAKKNAFDMGLF